MKPFAPAPFHGEIPLSDNYLDECPMKKSLLPALALLLLLPVAACSDDDGDNGNNVSPDYGPPLAKYGEACAKDAECATKMCANKTCTVTCAGPVDCPSVGSKKFHCGEVAAGKLACYAQTWDGVKAGTMGTSCVASGTCEAKHKCTGQVADADRYCAGECASDLECPPRYRCVATQQGNKAAETTRYCLKRAFCHPCAGDWQCPGVDVKCIKDNNGAGFCSKTCTPPTGTPGDGAVPGGTCPTYATCAKDGSAYYCQHKAGFCTRGFDGKGAQCDPCIVHGWQSTGSSSDKIQTVAEVGQCKSGHYCVLYDQYYGEAACLKTCTGDTDCGSSQEKCYKATSSLGTSVCKPWKSEVYNGQTYQVAAECPFK